MSNHRYTVTNLNKPSESVTVYWRLGLAASLLGTAVALLGKRAIEVIATLPVEFSPLAGLFVVPVSTALVYIWLADWTSSHLWRWGWSRFLLGIVTPRIYGTWTATVKKATGTVRAEDAGTLVVDQSWRTMSITLRTDRITSQSSSAALVVNGGVLRLEYQYIAHAIHDPDNQLVTHNGAAFVDLPALHCNLATNLKLSYFTEHGEVGTIRLDRQPDA
ncbi:hypothetical protein FBY03_12456 [Pseudomonas sp. SJZ079]|uniref:Cap15 family cyclic dinucleotide receptor domain-containing protein n=1 Tax=Pseudomonas sp. SJZ079 TaxID=2572887 RepID=UPI00119910D6|nr:hypothetical protein [Pseudomonas sp. SJZ079]TWC30368.1 hypothetical protein FBY03_12456 [Pseudomonas sp. SJZ079]